MYGCRHCKMDTMRQVEYCALTGELTNGAVMCDLEYERCPEYQNALKPIKPKREPKLIQPSTVTSAGL